MKKLGESEDAVSPVIGVMSMLTLTVIMISIAGLSVFSFALPESAPHARIVIVEARGGITKHLEENILSLKHKGGDFLDENNTKIIITGRGYAYTGTTPSGSAKNIRVVYRDLSGDNYGGEHGDNLGEIVNGTSWDAGDTLTLYGYDGHNIGTIFDQGNTVDNKWKLDAGSTVTVTIIHNPTNQVIAISQATVKEV